MNGMFCKSFNVEDDLSVPFQAMMPQLAAKLEYQPSPLDVQCDAPTFSAYNVSR